MYVLALRAAPGPWRGVNLADVDGVGLVSAMPNTAFAAILLMIVAFFVTIAQNTDRKFLLLFQDSAAITFALHGAAALIEERGPLPHRLRSRGLRGVHRPDGGASPFSTPASPGPGSSHWSRSSQRRPGSPT